MLPMLLSLALLVSGVSVADNPYNVEGALTPIEIADIAKEAGFPEEAIPEAVRIVLLESKGQSDKLQDNADDPAIGLFQVDLKPHWDLSGSKNPMRNWFKKRGVENRKDAVEWLKDPMNNAEAALQIWTDRKKREDSPTGWEAWSAYNGGTKPTNREQDDWDLATKAMELYIDSLEDEKDVVKETTESTPINTNVQLEGKEEFESQVPQQAGSFEGNQIKTNITRDMQPMSPRKQKINNNFVKLFESMVRAE